MNIATEETISAITVKMEGIARTRLHPPRSPVNERDSKRAEVEIHRVCVFVFLCVRMLFVLGTVLIESCLWTAAVLGGNRVSFCGD
jgi:hypothetical protein